MMGKETRKKLFTDESTIWSSTTNTINMKKFRGIIYRYFWLDNVAEEYFSVSSANPYKDLTNTTIPEKIYTGDGLVEKRQMVGLFTRDNYKDGLVFTQILIKKHYFMNPELSIYLLLNIIMKKDLTKILLCTI